MTEKTVHALVWGRGDIRKSKTAADLPITRREAQQIIREAVREVVQEELAKLRG
jgi:hypothetical protein